MFIYIWKYLFGLLVIWCCFDRKVMCVVYEIIVIMVFFDVELLFINFFIDVVV